jgi:hypothetical protein
MVSKLLLLLWLLLLDKLEKVHKGLNFSSLSIRLLSKLLLLLALRPGKSVRLKMFGGSGGSSTAGAVLPLGTGCSLKSISMAQRST